ncbi:MAG: hypothetical protein JNL10_10455 [Verrucomicrobiales bacterium]|nr:hypothetical protein [Verrucomicrobiales bacterium]
MNPLRNRLLLIGLLLALGGALWWTIRSRLQARRAAVLQQEALAAHLQDLAASDRAKFGTLRSELDELRRTAAATSGRSTDPVRDEREPDPEARWAAPPEHLPDWNPASPYVWIPKSVLPSFPIEPFTDGGALASGLESVLAVDPDREKALTVALSRLLAAARERESEGVMLSTEHLPGIADRPGDKLTVVVPGQTDDGARLRTEAEQALRQSLGEARTDLLIHWGKRWLEEQFGNPAAEPKVYSVLRHPNDTYALSIKTSASWMSVDGSQTFIDYVPFHLRAWFTPLQPSSAPAAKSGP